MLEHSFFVTFTELEGYFKIQINSCGLGKILRFENIVNFQMNSCIFCSGLFQKEKSSVFFKLLRFLGLVHFRFFLDDVFFCKEAFSE